MEYLIELLEKRIASKELEIKVLKGQLENTYKKGIQNILETESYSPKASNDVHDALTAKDHAIEFKLSLESAKRHIDCGDYPSAFTILNNLYK